jgi:hypothetical protein
MSDETADRPAEGINRRGHSGGGGGEPAPLQSRANFLQNWNWASVTQINRGLCARGGAQQGVGRETNEAVARVWEEVRSRELTLEEIFEFLKSCHRRAPFLFFNGNTFAEIGRALANALFNDLPFIRRKEVASAVAHFITGVLDHDSMAAIITSCSRTALFGAGDRVRTLRGTLHGVIVRVLEDGRLAWRPDGHTNELIALPESLAAEEGEGN